MNMRQMLDPEQMMISDKKMMLRTLKYEELLTMATGQQLLIFDYEEMYLFKMEQEQTRKELLESMEFYLRENIVTDKKMLLKFIEEIKDI